jgi:hypothetical protein
VQHEAARDVERREQLRRGPLQQARQQARLGRRGRRARRERGGGQALQQRVDDACGVSGVRRARGA